MQPDLLESSSSRRNPVLVHKLARRVVVLRLSGASQESRNDDQGVPGRRLEDAEQQFQSGHKAANCISWFSNAPLDKSTIAGMGLRLGQSE
jgi:hypothetical protein